MRAVAPQIVSPSTEKKYIGNRERPGSLHHSSLNAAARSASDASKARSTSAGLGERAGRAARAATTGVMGAPELKTHHFARLAQRCANRLLTGLEAASREAHLSSVGAQPRRAARQDHAGLCVLFEERYEHRGGRAHHGGGPGAAAAGERWRGPVGKGSPGAAERVEDSLERDPSPRRPRRRATRLGSDWAGDHAGLPSIATSSRPCHPFRPCRRRRRASAWASRVCLPRAPRW
jgi:hypothetical protein